MGVVCLPEGSHRANEWSICTLGYVQASDILLLHKAQTVTSKANDVQADQSRGQCKAERCDPGEMNECAELREEEGQISRREGRNTPEPKPARE